jgi:hypothetical protein
MSPLHPEQLLFLENIGRPCPGLCSKHRPACILNLELLKEFIAEVER